jgi:cobalt transporter subunit CbtB
MQTGHTITVAQADLKSQARVWPAAAAAMLGLVLIFGVGFAGPSAIHNAAHDARHIHAFPCH